MNNIENKSDSGSGKALVLFYDDDRYESIVELIAGLSKSDFRVLIFRNSVPASDNWKALTVELQERLSEAGLRSFSMAGFGRACEIVQNFAFANPRALRSLILIDPFGAHNSAAQSRVLSWIEEKLPLGLPLRGVSGVFDGRSFLQRIRCPVLAISTPHASEAVFEELKLIAQRVPTCWTNAVEGADTGHEVALLIRDFLDVPARFPQKRAAVQVSS